MGFGQGLSGLNAASQDLDVIGNNIANSATVGFKSSTASFADVYASSRVGLGTQVSNINQRFTVGTVETTGNQFDMAIDGAKGFFRLQGASGEVLYSRNGEFFVDKELYLTNAQGNRLTAFNADANGMPGNTLDAVRVPSGTTAPEATDKITFATNLDASQTAIPTTTVFNEADPSTYTKSTSLRIYDSLGNAHELTQYFVKRPDSGGNSQWEVHYSGGSNLSPITPASQTLTFNPSGVLTNPTAPLTLAATVTTGSPANPLAINLDYTGSTQFNSPFATQQTVNGHTAGEFTSISFAANGAIQANYTAGNPKILGYVALGHFNNLQGLQPVGGNAWVETSASGQAVLGTPGTNGLAMLKGQAVEKSNVDMGQEMVKMIIAQRTYQANAQTIKTQDQVLQTLITMR